MTVQDVDKIAAQFAVSIDQSQALISSWLDREKGTENENNDGSVQSSKQDFEKNVTNSVNPSAPSGTPLPSSPSLAHLHTALKPVSSKQGLGSKRKQEPPNYSKALQSLKHKLNKEQKEGSKNSTRSYKQAESSDSETESRSSVTKKQKRSSFIDTYKKKSR